MTPDNPYGPFDAAGGDTIRCPFCGEPDFDAIGLKNHFLRRWCEVFNDTPTEDPKPTQETRPAHAATCKLRTDPHDEREPVGPCTCSAAPAPSIAPWAVCFTCEQTKADHDGRCSLACDRFQL